VACHAVPYRFDRLDSDEGWFLKHFQKGEGGLYVEHVRRGVELAAAEPSPLLVFAGGQSDAAAGPRSEGQGYWLIAESAGWWGHTGVRGRATTEEFSLDSFQNLLYAVCRFREVAGRYPARLTAVGWAFKSARFHEHAWAMRWPRDRFAYVGVNDPPGIDEARTFEAERLELFRRDPYGVGAEPRSKREARNPFRRQHGYHRSCPELAGLLDFGGPGVFLERLPW